MKDSQARADIKKLSKSLAKVKAETDRMIELQLKDCPVCKHETLQKRLTDGTNYYWASIGTTTEGYLTTCEPSSPEWRCTVCGSKLKCQTETKCKVIKENPRCKTAMYSPS